MLESSVQLSGTSRLITLNSVAEHIKGNNINKIIILPPASGNIDQDGNTENIPDNFDNNDAIFEPVENWKLMIL